MSLQLLTTQQVAELVQRPRGSLEQDRTARVGIPFIKLGRLVRYLQEDVDQYLREHRVQTANV